MTVGLIRLLMWQCMIMGVACFVGSAAYYLMVWEANYESLVLGVLAFGLARAFYLVTRDGYPED